MQGQGLWEPILQAPALTCGLWKLSAGNRDSAVTVKGQLQGREGHVGPTRTDQGWIRQAGPLLRPLHGCEYLPKPLPPLNQKAHRQRERGGPHGGISTASCILSACLQASAALGWRNPGRGKTVRTSLVQQQRPLTSASCQPTAAYFPAAGGRDIHLFS